jgi:predicted NodU family carbamoyl transferase
MINEIYVLNKNYNSSIFIRDKIIEGKIVNIIGDSAEFGPRALGNTSTICLPTKENSEYINNCNNRINEMPMAPILLQKNLDFFFYEHEYLRCLDILKYMIITLRYKNIDFKKYDGIIHKHPIENYLTGRPQVLFEDQKNHILYQTMIMLDDINIKALINTSFNIHGLKTALLLEHIIDDFYFQKKRDFKNKMILIFLTKFNHYDYFDYKINKKIKSKLLFNLKIYK